MLETDRRKILVNVAVNVFHNRQQRLIGNAVNLRDFVIKFREKLAASKAAVNIKQRLNLARLRLRNDSPLALDIVNFQRGQLLRFDV